MGITSKFKSESFDWYDKTKERTHRDIPLNWMSNLNSHTWVEQHPDRGKTTPFLEYSPDTKLNFHSVICCFWSSFTGIYFKVSSNGIGIRILQFLKLMSVNLFSSYQYRYPFKG